ncbi:efflux transporter outer membrane subunit [Dokdonella koreensis]|uniref:RND efflux system, outer membrane lipoprotein, NodT family n=1 Tax=Dokdonella koreensis DS-123 TaxID=1300342 RepID=A0A160DUN4_9GAMM|nr:efflux transporter outer membrane subunit [Dokdonella koreensis]ANB18179.1 RND efflux system, outer membrane lipoprotein, NodT family [Dokdonella koreensis DS-123]
MAWHPHPFLASAVLALAGCAAVGPDYRAEPPPAPADWIRWRSASDAARDAAPGEAATDTGRHLPEAWWTVFGDPVLDRLQTHAADAGPDLQTAALRLARSRLQRDIASAAAGPDLVAGASATRQRQSEYGAGTRLVDALSPDKRDALIDVLSAPFTLYQAGFDAAWELDLWGRVRRTVEAADATVDAAAATLDDVRLAIAADVARGYFELRSLRRQIALTRSAIDTGSDTLALIQARADGGLVDDTDVARQRTLLADLRARLPPLQAQETVTINRLGLLLGLRPGELDDALAGADGAAAPLPDLALGLPSELARRRPDIRAAEARLHAATAGIGVAVADLYPRITLGVGAGFESFDADRFGDWGSRRWSIGPSLSLPIFDGGRRRATVALRTLEQREAAIAYTQVVRGAWQDVDDALTAYAAEQRRNRDLQEKRHSADQALALAQARYAGGLVDFLVELDAQRTSLDAQRELAESDARLRVGYVAVCKAIGGGSPSSVTAADAP